MSVGVMGGIRLSVARFSRSRDGYGSVLSRVCRAECYLSRRIPVPGRIWLSGFRFYGLNP